MNKFVIFLLCLIFTMVNMGSINKGNYGCARSGNRCDERIKCCRGMVCEQDWGLNDDDRGFCGSCGTCKPPKPGPKPEPESEPESEPENDYPDYEPEPEPETPKPPVCARKGKPCGGPKGTKCCSGLRCDLSKTNRSPKMFGHKGPAYEEEDEEESLFGGPGICVAQAIYG